MTLTIDLEKDKPPLGDLVEQTLSGTEVVITKGARPVAKLVAIAEKPIRQFGSAKGLIHIAEDFDEPLEDFRELMS